MYMSVFVRRAASAVAEGCVGVVAVAVAVEWGRILVYLHLHLFTFALQTRAIIVAAWAQLAQIVNTVSRATDR